jgi:hypothetical protein
MGVTALMASLRELRSTVGLPSDPAGCGVAWA